MSTEPEVPTVFEVMRRAVEVCDPEEAYPETADLLTRFEDRDEPVTTLANPDLEISEAAALDEGVAEPVEIMAVAVGISSPVMRGGRPRVQTTIIPNGAVLGLIPVNLPARRIGHNTPMHGLAFLQNEYFGNPVSAYCFAGGVMLQTPEAL